MNEDLESANKENTLNHLAVIMDGNRRWAGSKKLPTFAGHRAGVESLKSLVKTCSNKKIKILTAYAFSTENWFRKKNEVDFLLQLFIEVLDKELHEMNEQGIRLKFIGDQETLNPKLRFKIHESEKLTQGNNKITVQMAFNYGGRAEITNSVKKIVDLCKSNSISSDEINEDLVSKHLYTGDLPDPDLLIRTGGEQRISNYLLWQLAYTELYFTKTLWPDFAEKNLDEAISEFYKRKRRFGK
ncbi:MAG: polyprenyl diphosphate synthase [Candidatus Caenarcaniphilales bacterium]|nr:polyprenyl diphosphate synthase [Candidatus Caenarcaniphilales bacterium]